MSITKLAMQAGIGLMDSRLGHYLARVFNNIAGQPFRDLKYTPLEEFIDKLPNPDQQDGSEIVGVYIYRGIEERSGAVVESGLLDRLNSMGDVRVYLSHYSSPNGENPSDFQPSIEDVVDKDIAIGKNFEIPFGSNTYVETLAALESMEEDDISRAIFITTRFDDDGKPREEQPILYKAMIGITEYTENNPSMEIELLGVASNLGEDDENYFVIHYNRATINYMMSVIRNRLGLDLNQFWIRLNKARIKRGLSKDLD